MVYFEMVNIDYIMGLLDWKKSPEEQAQGIEMAQNIENYNVFLQPHNKKYNKNVWDNCALILSKKTDDELSPYLMRLLEWLQDLNWPGAYCILDRLQEYIDDSAYNYALSTCLTYAHALNDFIWERNLKMLKRKKQKKPNNQ